MFLLLVSPPIWSRLWAYNSTQTSMDQGLEPTDFGDPLAFPRVPQ